MGRITWKDVVYVLIAIPVAVASFIGGGTWFGLVVTVLLIYGPALHDLLTSP